MEINKYNFLKLNTYVQNHFGAIWNINRQKILLKGYTQRLHTWFQYNNNISKT